MRALLLFSGGLDSILAAYIMKAQNIGARAFYCHTVFSHLCCADAVENLSKITESLGISLDVIDISNEQIALVKKSKYGNGENLNPCIDCKILMFKKAKYYMEEVSASFIVSGEVLGERPMSQRKDVFNIIERDSFLRGMILRPLSAKLLKPTVPELKGWINRDNLYDIAGRGRKRQFKLADEFGIKEYPNPGGGCLLTNPCFCRRLKDLLTYCPDFGVDEADLLKLGRHFRLSERAKLVVARNEKEYAKIEDISTENSVKFIPQERKGPISLGVGRFRKSDFELAIAITAGYCKSNGKEKSIKIVTKTEEKVVIVPLAAGDRKKIEKFLI